MKKSQNIFKINKKTIYRVIAFHLFVVIAFAIPYKSLKKEKKNTLVVKNITVPRQIQQRVVHKKPILKKTTPIAAKRIVLQKKAPISSEKKTLISKLENQINALDKKTTNTSQKKELLVPNKIKSLELDKKVSNQNSVSDFKQLLVKKLQENLKLPEYGKVKVSFIIHPSGKISDIVILDYQSEKNQNYLNNSLCELQFKIEGKMFLEKQKFVVIFKNE